MVFTQSLTAASRASDVPGHRMEQPQKRNNHKAILDQFREFSVLKDLCHVSSCSVLRHVD